MNSDFSQPVNWMLAVLLVSGVAGWIAIWQHPGVLRRIAARYLARAEALERSRSIYENSLKRWHRQLGIEVRHAHSSKELAQAEIARADGKA